MSGPWYGSDGRVRWIDEPTRAEPTVTPLPDAMLEAQQFLEATETGEGAWEPKETPNHPIVAFARDVCGLELWPAQASLLTELYTQNVRTAVLILGRRSGKGRLASIVAVYESTVGADVHLAAVPKGEQPAVVCIATSERQAKILAGFIRGYFDQPGLSHFVRRSNETELELTNGMTILTLPATARSVRGYAVPVLLVDEAAWLLDTDGSPLSGEALWAALSPSTAQFPHGRIIVCSTPRWSTGWLPDLYRQAASGQFPDMKAWQAPTATMNPVIDRQHLATEQEKDPVTFAREFMAQFSSGVGAALDGARVREAVRRGLPQLGPAVGVSYVVAIDPAVSHDTWSLVVAHREGSGDTSRIVIDSAMGWSGSRKQPLDVRTVLDEVAAVARSYGSARVLIDQFAMEFVGQGLAERGVSVTRQPWTNENKVAALSSMREYVNTGRLSLPDHGPLVSELTNLEQTVMPSGRPRIAAPGTMHDDFAMSALAVVHDLHAGTHLAPGSSFSMVA